MRKPLYILFCFLLPALAFGQMKLVLNSTYLVLNGGTAIKPAYFELNNPATNAIIDLNTSNGWIISESEFNMVKWDIGTNTGSYIIPFGYSTLAYIPVTYNIITSGTGAAGTIKFSTYHGPTWDNLSYEPSDVTNMNGVTATDNSANVTDRFWIIEADSGYSVKPVSTITFTYIHSGLPSEIASPNTINEPTLIAERFNNSSNIWGDWLGAAGTDATSGNTGTVSTGTVNSADLFRSWTLANDSAPLYSLPPQVKFKAYDSVICTGDSIKFINESKFYSPATWNWTFAGGVPATSTQDTPTVTYNASGTYLVKLVASNNNGTDSMIKTAYITVNPLPTVTFSGADSVCKGDSTTITASGGLTYLWSTGATTSAITIKPSADSTFNVSVGNGSCSKDTSIHIKVNSVPLAIISPDTSICAGDSINISASGGTLYTWSTGATTGTITVKPFSDSTFKISVSNGYCAIDTSIIVNVNPAPIANASGDTAICYGTSVTLNASGGVLYTWMPSSGLNNTSTSTPTATPSVTTTYSVIVSNGACTSKDSVKVIVNSSPSGNVTGGTTINQGETTILSAPSGLGYSYMWIPNTNLSCDTCQSTIASPTVTTTYTVVIRDSIGCSLVDTVTISVTENCGDVFVPGAFSPNNDGHNDILYVRGNCIKDMVFIVYNRWGNKVFESDDPAMGWDGTYHGKKMNKGTYAFVLKATLKDNTVKFRKGNIELVR